ncbi:uncharacterized protein FTOL_09652 [Fusarium torulosum]|uniref:Uncharacterized protein n=1 Tax=Fusarium torulosum TaxID=33205 RepID=A0AAE8MGK3_9HYPO|nr:uncharacterized protein FTOL_09652 [Fusarium torulosum]
MQQHLGTLSENDQDWLLVSDIEELTVPEKQIPLSTAPYSMTIGKHTREIKIQDIEDKNSEFAPYFDEERCFKHNDWPEGTKRIILGYILHKDVLKELKAKDPQKTRLLHFICLLKFREHVLNINVMDLRLTAEIELAHVTWELPFTDILRSIVKRPEWCAFDQDNALLMILVQRVNAWNDNIPVTEILPIIQSWPEEDLNPTNLVLKFAIELKVELQGCRRLVSHLAHQVTEANAKPETNEKPAKANEQPAKTILGAPR